jgi:ankyrin repeat protein
LVGLLVQSGAKLHVRNSHHLLPVELARKKSHWAYIEVMAENVNAIDNVKDRYKFGLCLFDAVANNLPAKALKLLNANADPNAVSISCLHWAAKNNYIELLEPLAKAKVKPQATNSSHHTAVEEAALNQHWDFVIKHAELFPDTEQQYNYHKVLMMAFKNVKVAVAKALILAKSKLDLLDEFSNTALHYAVEIQSAELVAILAKDKKLLTIRNYPERKTAFQKACDALAWHCIKAFAENITNANTLDDNYRLELGLGLLLAAKYNETAVAIALINAQTPVILTSTDDMNSCVHWACIYDNTHLLEILLRAHASLHFVNENGLNPLQLSESLGHDECVNMLTNYDNFQRFYTAMLMQEFDLAKLILIEHKEIFCMYALVTEDGETALHLVAFHNLPELVTLLIAAGADLAALDKKRRTPILAAAENKSYAAIEAFVDAVADEEGTYGYGSAMLTVYHEEEYILADKLLARKADVKFHDPGLITCLVLSCQRARKDDIVKFLTFGADPETGPDRESRPIAILAANRHWDCLHAFLSFIKVEDNLDDRLLLGFALPYTLYNGQLGLSLKLIELNADVNYEYDGENCLHLAIKGGMFSLIKPLLRAGADPHAVNSENMTPIAMANAQDKNVRRRNRFNFFARPVYFNISMSIAAVEAEQAVPSVAPSLSLRAG